MDTWGGGGGGGGGIRGDGRIFVELKDSLQNDRRSAMAY